MRLIAIDMALSGKRVEEAAESAHVRPKAVKRWLAVITRDGIVQALERWESKARPRKLDADAMALRELAVKESKPRIRKRMLALACVADGMSPYVAAVSVGVGPITVHKRLARFQEEGVAAFQDRKIAGRPRKLSAAQFQELRLEVLERPEMSYTELRDLVWARFRARYSLASLRRLLKKQLGIVWNAGRFTAAARSHCA